MKNLILVITVLILAVTTFAQEKKRPDRDRRNSDDRRNQRQDDRDQRQNNRNRRDQNKPPRDHDRRGQVNRRNTDVSRDQNRRANRDSYQRTQRRVDRRVDRRNDRRTVRRHTPYTNQVRHNRRWSNSRDYHRTLNSSYVYNNRWLRVRVSYDNGYWYGDYPYFINNGYRHRYSSWDNCNYELVDSYSDSVERTYYSYSCSTGYDLCADMRDDLNEWEWDDRFFCAEKYSW